jgi:hypothetical protein
MDPPPEETPARDWSLLPLDALSSVFVRVGAVDVLMGAGLVCRSWLQAAKVPDVWRVVDMESHHAVFEKRHFVLRAMAKAAVDRSDGQLRMFAGKEFVTHGLIRYIVERCFSLSLYTCFHKSFQIFVYKYSLLDHPMKEIVFLQVAHTDYPSACILLLRRLRQSTPEWKGRVTSESEGAAFPRT